MAVWSKWVRELKKRVIGNPAESTKDSAPKKKLQNKDVPQGRSAPAAPKPAVPVQRKLTEKNLEKWRILLQFVVGDLVKKIQQHVPEPGKTDRCGVGFKLDGTENQAYLVVERPVAEGAVRSGRSRRS